MDIEVRVEELMKRRELLISKLEEIEKMKPQIAAEINFIDGSLQVLNELKTVNMVDQE